MVEIINLNSERKRRALHKERRKASENRVRFGQSRAQKLAVRDSESRSSRVLDGARLDTVPASSDLQAKATTSTKSDATAAGSGERE